MNIYVCMTRICILYNAAENARLRYADNDIYIYIYNTWKECKGIVKDNSYVKLKFSFRKCIVLGIIIFSCYKRQ